MRKKRKYRNGQTRLMEPPNSYQKNFLSKMDFRTEKYHVMDFEYRKLITDLGGMKEISAMEKILAERLVFVSYLIRECEVELATCENGKYAELMDRWTKLDNACNSIIAKLGVSKRKSGKSELKKHIAEKYEEIEE